MIGSDENELENISPEKEKHQEKNENNIGLDEQKPKNKIFKSTQSYFDQIEIEDSEFSKEESYMDKFNNFLTPFLKLFILLPGKIMRLILQIGDFYFFLEILSITIEYLIITLISNFNTCKYFGPFVSIFFSFLFGNLLAVPAWELFQLRWIRNKNPLQAVFNIFNFERRINNYETHVIYIIEKGTNFVLGIILYIYLFTIVDFMHSSGKKFDIMNSIVILFIPAIKFGLIFISLVIRLSFNLKPDLEYKLLKMKPPPPQAKKNERSEDEDDTNINPVEHEDKKDINHHNSDEFKKILRDPFIIARIVKKDFFKDKKQYAFFIIKLLFFALQLIFQIISYCKNKVDAGGIVFSLIIFICMFIFNMLISMPFFFINIFNRYDNINEGDCKCGCECKCRCKCGCKAIRATEGANGIIRSNPFFNGFKHIIIICHILPTLVVAILLIMELKRSKDSYFVKSDKDITWDGQTTGKYPYIPPMSTVKSSMCFTRIYGMTLIQIASLAAAPYYSDEDHYQMLIQKSFFRDENDEIKLTFLNKTDDHPVLLQADYDNKVTNNNATVFAVRGSRTPTDWWLDVEIFVSSAMLSVARWIPYLQRQEGITAKLVSNFMTLPLTLMAKATLTYTYITEMAKTLDNIVYSPEYQNRNILFVGHSLGGGLSKVLAHKYQFQSVAVSGPGITPIENYVLNKSKKNDKYFKSKLVDIIPDRDLVPRFEMSGGTKYRVLCKKNTGECHNKLRTLCQMGISCDDEYHSGDFCSSVFKDGKYEEMRELAHK